MFIGLLYTNASAPPAPGDAKSAQSWWPERLNLAPPRAHSPQSSPYGESFDYAEAFASVDYAQLRQDIKDLMTTSQDW